MLEIRAAQLIAIAIKSQYSKVQFTNCRTILQFFKREKHTRKQHYNEVLLCCIVEMTEKSPDNRKYLSFFVFFLCKLLCSAKLCPRAEQNCQLQQSAIRKVFFEFSFVFFHIKVNVFLIKIIITLSKIHLDIINLKCVVSLLPCSLHYLFFSCSWLS